MVKQRQGEISYDLIMKDDMLFVEGTYRLESDEWRVFICSKQRVAAPSWCLGTWESGVSGITFRVPLAMPLNMATVEGLMSQALGSVEWRRVAGPDSIRLR